MTPVRWSRSSTKSGAKANIYSGLVCRLLRFPFSPCLTTISLAESHVLALLSYREGMPRTVLGRLHGPPRQTLLTAGRAARQRIEAQFDERIAVEAALGLVQD